jgi:hypothetical protein
VQIINILSIHLQNNNMEYVWSTLCNLIDYYYGNIDYTKLFIEIILLIESDAFATKFLTTYSQNIDVDSKNTDCMCSTPIMFAVEIGLIETTKLLVEQFMCDLDYENNLLFSAEHYGLFNGLDQYISLIKNERADIIDKDMEMEYLFAQINKLQIN